ncbi:hypothetical protein VTI74DRAFT_3018 [Chaetomium olivicolor]
MSRGILPRLRNCWIRSVSGRTVPLQLVLAESRLLVRPEARAQPKTGEGGPARPAPLSPHCGVCLWHLCPGPTQGLRHMPQASSFPPLNLEPTDDIIHQFCAPRPPPPPTCTSQEPSTQRIPSASPDRFPVVNRAAAWPVNRWKLPDIASCLSIRFQRRSRPILLCAPRNTA